MAGQQPPSTATVMERVPLLLLSKSAVTYLVDTLTCLGLALVSIILFQSWLLAVFFIINGKHLFCY